MSRLKNPGFGREDWKVGSKGVETGKILPHLEKKKTVGSILYTIRLGSLIQ